MLPVDILRTSRTIAVVGISDKSDRTSYQVALQLERRGFSIIPVNPLLAEWRGRTAYPSVSAIPAEIKIDIVDVFRKSEQTPDVVRDALSRAEKPRCIWLQLGIMSEESRALTEAVPGVLYVEDRCTAVEAALGRITLESAA